MITKLTPPFNLYDHSMTSTVVSEQASPNPGDNIRVHVEEVMAKIEKGEEKISTVYTKGATLFCNDSSCKPHPSTSLQCQNYITMHCGKNANWDGIDIVNKTASGKILSRVIPAGLTVQATFQGGLVDHGIIETTRDMQDYNINQSENTSMMYSGDMSKVYVSDPDEIGILSAQVNELVDRLQSSKILGQG